MQTSKDGEGWRQSPDNVAADQLGECSKLSPDGIADNQGDFLEPECRQAIAGE